MSRADERLHRAIGKWIPKLEKVPGWQDWNRKKFGKTLWFDDPWEDGADEISDFVFPAEIEAEHNVIMAYHALNSTVTSLRDCEYYFRRYPFHDLPVHKHEHLRYICEMYLGRFYEFRARLKECLNAAGKVIDQPKKIDVGAFLKIFDREFDQEIRARNRIHHHDRFEDIAIDNLMIISTVLDRREGRIDIKRRRDAAYRRASKEWAQRAARRASDLQIFLEAVANLILLECNFLEAG